jgi:hypothetical protein
MNDIPLPALSRPAFFTGQRLLPETLDQAFLVPLSLHELHNRALHGHGIGIGLDLRGERGATVVVVSPGYAIDAGGRDLIVAEPVTVGVPPVSSAPDGTAIPFTLVVSATTDEAARVELSGGVCATSGAVRRDDAPTIRFEVPELVRDGLDVVLAQVTVQNCRLTRRWSPSGRLTILPAGRPQVSCGATEAGGTGWRPWPSAGSAIGAVASVSTAAAGFGDTPRYQARIEGERFANGILVDGPISVESPTPNSFDAVVLLPRGFALAGGVPLNPPGVHADGFLDERGWRVVWIGVEG